MIRYFVICLIFSFEILIAHSFTDFDDFQEKITKEAVDNKIKTFLEKDPQIASYFESTEDALIIYDSPNTNQDRQIDYVLKFCKSGLIPSHQVLINKKQNLVGVKIAIDPGHIGGDFAHLEERYISIDHLKDDGDSIIEFNEGTLSFLTAYYLKLLLEQEGAIVLMTRKEIGQSVYEEDFFDWLRNNRFVWSDKSPLSKIFRDYYNPLDLKARAKKINEFHPDLTVIIHYNAMDVSSSKTSNANVTEKNFNMAFIPGSFERNELNDVESRYEFVRLILTDDIEQSKQLSQSILKNFTHYLNVPIVSEQDGANYLNTACIKVDEGIYARNLLLTRTVHGPLCYGETLIQNNEKECVTLNKKDFLIHEIPCSSRIKEVAYGYFEGIKSYLLQETTIETP